MRDDLSQLDQRLTGEVTEAHEQAEYFVGEAERDRRAREAMKTERDNAIATEQRMAAEPDEARKNEGQALVACKQANAAEAEAKRGRPANSCATVVPVTGTQGDQDGVPPVALEGLQRRQDVVAGDLAQMVVALGPSDQEHLTSLLGELRLLATRSPGTTR